MMNEIMVFDNEEFGKVRTVMVEGVPHFVGKDVADILGYSVPSRAINTHCKGVTKMVVPTNGGDQEVQVIPESDLYRLIIKSQLPSAERFEEWVMEEVLPSIRKDGSFDVIENNLQKIDDDEEKKLSLLVHSLEKTFEIDPSNVTIGILLGQAKADLQSYKVQQSIDEVKEDVAKIRQQGAWVGDRTTFNDKVQILARKFFNKDIKEAYDMLYARMRQLDGFDVNARMRIAKEKLNQERIEKVGKPYAESTLKQRVTGLDIIEENDKWTVASEAYNSIENEMYELRQGY